MKENLEKIYQLKVSLDKKIYRVIEIEGSSSLYSFAKAITKAFGFDFDHAFGFYNNIKDEYKSTEKFELFFDMGEADENSQSVKNTKVVKVFFPKKQMLFLFDYGDDWHFLVDCLDILEAKSNLKYPKVTKVVGKAPEQYPECEEDYDEE